MTTCPPSRSRLALTLAFSLALLATWAAGARAQDSPDAKKSAPTSSKSKSKSKKADAPKADEKAESADKAEPAKPIVDFSGNWHWTFTGPNGFTYEPTLRIRQKGSKLSGTIYGKRGGSLPVRDVRITKESNVAFTLDREFYGLPMEVKFIGKLDKNTITGKMGVFANGSKEPRVFDWSARRVRDDGSPVPDPPAVEKKADEKAPGAEKPAKPEAGSSTSKPDAPGSPSSATGPGPG